MPVIGWIFLIIAVGMVVGSLLLLRDTANTMPLSGKRMKKIRQRKAQLKARRKAGAEKRKKR